MWANGPRFIPILCFHMERRFFSPCDWRRKCEINVIRCLKYFIPYGEPCEAAQRSQWRKEASSLPKSGNQRHEELHCVILTYNFVHFLSN